MGKHSEDMRLDKLSDMGYVDVTDIIDIAFENLKS